MSAAASNQHQSGEKKASVVISLGMKESGGVSKKSMTAAK